MIKTFAALVVEEIENLNEISWLFYRILENNLKFKKKNCAKNTLNNGNMVSKELFGYWLVVRQLKLQPTMLLIQKIENINIYWG